MNFWGKASRGAKHRGSLSADRLACGLLETLAPAMHGDGRTIPR